MMSLTLTYSSLCDGVLQCDTIQAMKVPFVAVLLVPTILVVVMLLLKIKIIRITLFIILSAPMTHWLKVVAIYSAPFLAILFSLNNILEF
jgi:hypothetical protein